MKATFSLALIASFIATTAKAGISVWPLPSHYTSGDSVLWIAEDVQFTYTAPSNLVSTPLLGPWRSFRC